MCATREITRLLISVLLFFFSVVPFRASYFAGNSDLGTPSTADFETVRDASGRAGGTLIASQHSEPKTFNPLFAMDVASKNIIGLMMADLIHINRATLRTEPGLAKSWTVSPDHRRYLLQLREGVRFSDGSPFTADDVVFSWNCYLDARTHSPQRDLLTISGQPIQARKVSQYTVEFTLSQPYAAAERLFDGIAILPRHLLEQRFQQGTLASAWGLDTAPDQIAGLGPFRFRRYTPGQRVVLERNPYYWKRDAKGQPLPYLNSIVSIVVASADAEALRFDAGDTDVISRLSPADFDMLQPDQQARHFHLYDLGPGLEYEFLFFNENTLPPGSSDAIRQKQSWFRRVQFRRAISSAIDRADLVRIAYRNRARPLSVQVTPGNKLWIDHDIPLPVYSIEKARELMREDGFSWNANGLLVDRQGRQVEFSLLVNAGNPQQVKMAALIQHDLAKLGIGVALDEMEFHSLLNRIFTSYQYEAAILGLVDGDADPNSEMNVLTSTGSTHIWNLKPGNAIPAWQGEVDRLMREQMITTDYEQRKHLYDRVQQILWQYVPVIFLVSPDVLVGAKDRVGNFHPAILGNYTLWNADRLFIRQ